jgi:hypothetical protein
LPARRREFSSSRKNSGVPECGFRRELPDAFKGIRHNAVVRRFIADRIRSRGISGHR